jgi:hypothetical protein
MIRQRGLFGRREHAPERLMVFADLHLHDGLENILYSKPSLRNAAFRFPGVDLISDLWIFVVPCYTKV